MLQITEQFWSEISSTSKRKKSFCSAFVVFLRETIGLPILTYTFIIISGAAAAAASTPTLFSPVIADNNHPPPQLPQHPLLPLPWGTFAEEKRHPSRGGNLRPV
jgi:hypothetical protein